MEAGKGKSRDFRLSPSPCQPSGQKGFLRGSRKWMIRLGEKFASVVVSPVYLLRLLAALPAFLRFDSVGA
jgi:hypothetical protein